MLCTEGDDKIVRNPCCSSVETEACLPMPAVQPDPEVAVACASWLSALVSMSNDPAAWQRRDEVQRADHAGVLVQALTGLTTAVATALTGVYMATRSVIVTALVASLILALATCALVRRSRRQS